MAEQKKGSVADLKRFLTIGNWSPTVKEIKEFKDACNAEEWANMVADASELVKDQ
jgi:hypothetical protein